MSDSVLVINAGSSSLKYQLVDVATRAALASGLIERIGEAVSALSHKNLAGPEEAKFTTEAPVPDHTEALKAVLRAFELHGPDLASVGMLGVGHRVVQGAERYSKATLLTPAVIADIEEFSPLAPLHNPANLMGIRAAAAAFPGVPQVAVFDTAFHQTLPPAAYTYALPPAVAAEHRIRRYGFHGTSHQFVSRECATLMGRDPAELNIITVHIGSGCSMAAVRGGQAVDTTMGLTPLAGLVMGSRTGDVDPAIVFHLVRQGGYTIDQIDTMFNKQSGLLGMAGSLDMRDIHQAIAAGDQAAKLAFDVFIHRLRSYIGAYAFGLGRVDALVFTAGIGENDPAVRAAALAGLEGYGFVVDPERNAGRGGSRLISPDGAPVQVWVIPTNEEYEIAHQAADLIAALR